ncbi:hypothetical protein FUAX_23880 [Fulvitalea axinellae]|uniref:Methyltransferase domain-containing protein n=1 Tax=Fulvitalea axinellae TaxID=1182444 RepID=A0AAU9DAJ7_9BACT|nr:hypothetical protein FUAX_23880 [Fulvitalea axinellae]
MKEDLYGKGLYRYYKGEHSLEFKLHNDYGSPEMMPIEVFFEGEDSISELEELALENCKGKVLDIGAGAGRHSLILQDRGFDVKAIDISPLAVELMRERGVTQAEKADILTLGTEGKYDTLLLLMNGLGLAQKLDNVSELLNKLKQSLAPGGQIIFDSSDLAYLYENEPLPFDKYYGEVNFRYELDEEKGKWFGWVYVDPRTMKSLAEKAGFHFEILFVDDNDQYLAKLTL